MSAAIDNGSALMTTLRRLGRLGRLGRLKRQSRHVC
jgi:hypothetical protein